MVLQELVDRELYLGLESLNLQKRWHTFLNGWLGGEEGEDSGKGTIWRPSFRERGGGGGAGAG